MIKSFIKLISVFSFTLTIASCSTLQLNKPWSKLTYNAAWGPCAARVGDCQESWTILSAEPKTLIRRDRMRRHTKITLNDIDAKRVYSVVNGADFQNQMQNGFKCPLPPTDVFRSITLDFNDGTKLTQDVTGCSLSTEHSTHPFILESLFSNY